MSAGVVVLVVCIHPTVSVLWFRCPMIHVPGSFMLPAVDIAVWIVMNHANLLYNLWWFRWWSILCLFGWLCFCSLAFLRRCWWILWRLLWFGWRGFSRWWLTISWLLGRRRGVRISVGADGGNLSSLLDGFDYLVKLRPPHYCELLLSSVNVDIVHTCGMKLQK